MVVLGALVQLLVGALAWTLAEYVLHRFDMHGRWSQGATAREHRTHHATLDVPALTAGTWVGAGLVALAFVIGGRPAVAVGWMAAYVGYELVHRRIHAPPAPGGHEASPYRRWVTAHHMHHHLAHAGADFGVTSPLWDVVFRTYRRPRAGDATTTAGRVGVDTRQARQARAPRRTRG